ncbi:MnhB domain-containing protein [Geomicrobium sp. JCM 19038]|uniref:MnhB domain-containing protein n=1 Tax=Geomicrobium sp. JCM 19038 TaxID=1460635 RepID=UPI000ACA6E9A
MKVNDVILQTVTKIVVFIIFTFAFYLFFAGHHDTGGGFIGGLWLHQLVLLYLSYDIDTISKAIPINYRTLIGVGVSVSMLTGLGSILLGFPFLSHTFEYVDFPFFGRLSLPHLYSLSLVCCLQLLVGHSQSF